MNQSNQPVMPDPGKTIVVFGCHPDDAEFLAGGLVARHTRAGGKAVLVHLEPAKPDLAKAQRAADFVGARAAYFRTNEFDVTEDAVNVLHEALEEFRPALFVCISPFDMHPQHSAFGFTAFRAVVDVLGGGDTKLREGDGLWFGELNPGVACRAFRPDIWVDITDVVDDKWRAIGVYKSSKEMENPSDLDGVPKDWGWFGENQVVVEKFRGYECGCHRAEAFTRYNGWAESPLDRPWGVPMYPGREFETPFYEEPRPVNRKTGEYKFYKVE